MRAAISGPLYAVNDAPDNDEGYIGGVVAIASDAETGGICVALEPIETLPIY